VDSEGVDLALVDWRGTAENLQAEVLRLKREIVALEQALYDEAHARSWLLMRCRAVVRLWVDGDGPIPEKRAALRELVEAQGYSGAALAGELDDLAESV